jgi:toxin ParE1/3/4
MRVRRSVDAADDLARIVERIRQDNPLAARRVAEIVFTGVVSLRTFPNRGRVGVVQGTRELVFAPLPFIAV